MNKEVAWTAWAASWLVVFIPPYGRRGAKEVFLRVALSVETLEFRVLWLNHQIRKLFVIQP